jgi:hypothetical protein
MSTKNGIMDDKNPSMELVYTSSRRAKRTFNPIRHIVDNLQPNPLHALPLVNLALGDPTAYGNLSCPLILSNAIKDLLE